MKRVFFLPLSFLLLASFLLSATYFVGASPDGSIDSISSDKEDVGIGVEITFGRASRNCRGFGICKIKFTFDLFKVSGENGDGTVLVRLTPEGVKEVQKHFGSNKIILEEPYVLPKELTDALDLKPGYTLSVGEYKVQKSRKLGYYVAFE